MSAPLSLATVERELPGWLGQLQAGLNESIRGNRENLGHLAEQIMQRTREVARLALEEAT